MLVEKDFDEVQIKCGISLQPAVIRNNSADVNSDSAGKEAL